MALPTAAGNGVGAARPTVRPQPPLSLTPDGGGRSRGRRPRQPLLLGAFVAVVVIGFGLGLYLARDQLQLGQWMAGWPLIGGPVRTYQQGLQESARLAEAQKGIEQERRQLQQQAQALAAERQQLTLVQQALERQKAQLDQETAALQAAREQLLADQRGANRKEQALRIYRQLRPAELAAILDTQSVEEAAAILAQLPTDQAAAAVAQLPPLKATRLLQTLAPSPVVAQASAPPR